MIEADAMFAGSLFTTLGYLASRISERMRQAMEHDEVVTAICAKFAEVLALVPEEKYAEASHKFAHARHLANSIVSAPKRVRRGPRTYSFKPGLRAKG